MATSSPLQEPLLDVNGAEVTDDAPLEAPLSPDESNDWPDWNLYAGSFRLLCLVALLDSIEYGFIMPAIYKFMTELDPDEDEAQLKHLYGVVLSVFSFAALVTRPFLGWYCDRRPFQETFILSTCVAITGNLIYFFARPLSSAFGKGYNVLVVARVLSGIGCANTALAFAFISRTAAPEKRTKLMTLLSMIKVAGFQIGPATNLLTSFLDFHVGGFKVDSLNSPGAGIALCQMVVVVLLLSFKEPPPYREEKEESRTDFKAVFALCNLNVLLNITNICSFNFFVGCMEAMSTPVTHDAFGWSPLQNSFIFMVITGVNVVLSVVVIKLSGKGVEDRVFLLVAGILFTAGPVVMYQVWFYDMSVLQFYIGVVAACLGCPFGFAPNRSNFSKAVEGNRNQALLQSSLSLFASVGSILGPLYVGVTLGIRDPNVKHQRVAPNCILGLIVLGTFTLAFNGLVLWVLKRTPASS